MIPIRINGNQLRLMCFDLYSGDLANSSLSIELHKLENEHKKEKKHILLQGAGSSMSFQGLLTLPKAQF